MPEFYSDLSPISKHLSKGPRALGDYRVLWCTAGMVVSTGALSCSIRCEPGGRPHKVTSEVAAPCPNAVMDGLLLSGDAGSTLLPGACALLFPPRPLA